MKLRIIIITIISRIPAPLKRLTIAGSIIACLIIIGQIASKVKEVI